MSDVEDIKTRVDIVSLIGESVPLRKAGRNFKGLCPFHSEKTPSFMVSPERQMYHCFGCGEGGDIFEFIMKREAADFPEALRMLAVRAGVKLTGFHKGDSKAKQRLFEANAQAAKYFRATLQHAAGKVALDYLTERGISEQTAIHFQIGYAPDDYEALVRALRKKEFTEKELVDAGLAGHRQWRGPARGGDQSSRGLYARFRHRLMIPINDSQGVTRGFTGRLLDASAKEAGLERSREAKYVNTPETNIYHKGKLVFALDLAKQAVIDEGTVVLVEGQMDVITAHQAGTQNVIATSGTTLTEEQLRQLTRFTKTLTLALDSDDAGRKAMLRVIELVGDRDVELRVVNLGQAKDPDELITTNPEAWQEAIKQAEPVIDYLLSEGLAAHHKPYNRQAITAILDSVLSALQYRSVLDQDYYAEQLAQALGVAKASVADRLKKRRQSPSAKASEITAPSKRQTPEELVSERMLGLIAMTPELTPKLTEIDERVFPERYRAAAGELKKGYNSQVSNEAYKTLLDTCALAALEYEPLDTEERAAEFDRLYTRLKSLWVKQHQPKLLAAIKRAERSGDLPRRNRLMEEYTSLTKRTVHG